MTSIEEFERRGDDVWSLETNTLVARIDVSGSPIMEKGKKGMEKRVRAWLQTASPEPAEPVPAEVTAEVPAEVTESPEPEAEENPVAPFWPEQDKTHVPDAAELGLEMPSECPARLDPALGVDTPGFREYCESAKLSDGEIVDLIKELQ